MAVLDDQLHTAGLRDYLLHLGKVYEEGTVATDNHRVVMKVVFHLFGGGTKHVGANLIVAQMAHLHIVADRLDKEQVADVQRDFLARRS